MGINCFCKATKKEVGAWKTKFITYEITPWCFGHDSIYSPMEINIANRTSLPSAKKKYLSHPNDKTF